MLNIDKDIAHIETTIKKIINTVEIKHFNLVNDYHQIDLESQDENKEYILWGVKRLYNLILVYLEYKNLPNYAAQFKNEFEDNIKDSNYINKDGFIYLTSDYPELFIVDKFHAYLSPFPAFNFDSKENEQITQLKEILKSTSYIIKNSKVEISNEASIYNAVFWVLKLYYSKCRRVNKASFIRQFKKYEPDILIPELGVAIEYKYINNKKTIDDYIDEIKTDSVNYIGDTLFQKFIAVIYLKDNSIATEQNILAAWNEKQMPKNWELVIVFH